MTISIPINTIAIMDKEVINELLNNSQKLIFQYMINNKIFSGYVTDLNIGISKQDKEEIKNGEVVLLGIEGVFHDISPEKTFIFRCPTQLDTLYGSFFIELQLWRLDDSNPVSEKICRSFK